MEWSHILGTDASIFGFFHKPSLIVIAILVFLAEQGEAAHVEKQSELKALRARDAMMTGVRTLSTRDSLRKAVEEWLAGSQQDFPVVDDREVLAILRWNHLLKALAEGPHEGFDGKAMCRDRATVRDTDSLPQTLEVMRQRECSTMPVFTHEQNAGLLTLENISEVLG